MNEDLGNLTLWMEQLIDEIVAFIPNLVISLIIFFFSLYLAGLISRLLARWLKPKKTDPELNLLIETTTKWVIYILGATMALNQIGFNLTAFLTGLGILGFTIGFAIQDISKNFIAGLLLLIEQPFDIGDGIEVAGYSGTILKVDLRATEMQTWDGRIVLIPNSDVFTNAIINHTKATRRRIELEIGVAYDTDLEAARNIALEVTRRIDGVLDNPEPQVVYSTLGDSAVLFTIYYWIDTDNTDLFTAQDQGVVAIKEAFERRQIEIPFPIQTILLKQE